jgi:hypothetical protein
MNNGKLIEDFRDVTGANPAGEFAEERAFAT